MSITEIPPIVSCQAAILEDAIKVNDNKFELYLEVTGWFYFNPGSNSLKFTDLFSDLFFLFCLVIYEIVLLGDFSISLSLTEK
jgi:hypothetical protein